MNNVDVNKVLIRRNGCVSLPTPKKKEGHLSNAILMSIQKEVNRYGYVFDVDAISKISALSKKQVKSFLHDLLPATQLASGRIWAGLKPFYPNFPEEVIDADEMELFHNAMVHYFGAYLGFHVVPESLKSHRAKIKESEFENAKKLSVNQKSEQQIAFQIIDSGFSISADDFADVVTLIGNNKDDVLDFMNMLSVGMNRENLAHALVYAHSVLDIQDFAEVFDSLVMTATDVLRYLVGRSGGSVALEGGNPERFKNISRPERRIILSLLNGLDNATLQQDISRHESSWKRVARILHLWDYKGRYRSVEVAFSNLASNSLTKSFAGQFDILTTRGSLADVLELVSDRPGEFARRLNQILTFAGNKADQRVVLSEFRNVSKDVPSNILWQMLPLFEYRNNDENRVIFPKGNVSRSVIIPMPEKAYSKKISEKASDIIVEEIISKYSEMESLDKVWVDPELVNYTIPVGMRSASKSENAIGRGTRIPFSDKKVQRFFLFWRDNDAGRVDVDLSAMFYDENMNRVMVPISPDGANTYGYRRSEAYHVSYQNLRVDGVTHSGDFVSAPEGAVEYVDVEVDKLKSHGVRYVSMVAQVYSGQPFSELECFAGVMGRDDPQAGEQFDARTVERSFEISCGESSLVPMVVDLERGDLVWCDIAGTVNNGYENVTSKSDGLTRITEGILNKRFSNLYQLFLFHAMGRASKLVDDKADADVVFEVVDGKPNVTLDEILSVFL